MKVLLLVVLIHLLSCNAPTNKDQENESKIEHTSVDPGAFAGAQQCYLFIAAKDTYALELTIVDDTVKGTAVYKNYEKDSSEGSVVGDAEGDIIHLWYSFQSEGMNSVRELYFKRSGDELITGVSDEQTVGDTAQVTDPQAVQYTGPVYAKADCELVPHLK